MKHVRVGYLPAIVFMWSSFPCSRTDPRDGLCSQYALQVLQHWLYNVSVYSCNLRCGVRTVDIAIGLYLRVILE
jgi:hypothetical protein